MPIKQLTATSPLRETELKRLTVPNRWGGETPVGAGGRLLRPECCVPPDLTC